MVTIIQDLVKQSLLDSKTYGRGNPKKKLVVHQTGNTGKGADAKMHAKYQHNGAGGRQASWHIQSDDKVIIQSYPFDYRCFHASTGNAPNGGNMTGIGWEICINSDGDYIKSLELAAEGIAHVMKQEGIPMSGLVRHHDEDPKKQRCPRQLMDGKDGVTWDKFKAMVEAHLNGTDEVPTTPQKAPEAPKKVSAEQVAQDIAVGKGGWGNNPERANKLKAAGYDANAVQSRVNDILKGKTKTVPNKSSGPRVGQTVPARPVYVYSASTKNVRSSPVKGYIQHIDNGWKNPIRLTNGKNGSWLGFTRPGDIL